MRARAVLSAALIIFATSGGLLAKNHPDEDPKVMAYENCAEALEAFRRKGDRYFFAISADATVCTFSFCQGGGCRKSQALYFTIRRCEKESGTTCKRYGAEDRVPEVEGE